MLTNLRTYWKSIAWGAGSFAVMAGLFFLGQAVYLHVQEDHLNHHLVVELIKYNIARGHLEPLPVAQAPTLPPPPVKK